MSELVLVSNPRHRRKSRKSRKGRMPAGLARYWAKHRRGRKTKTHHRRRPHHTARVTTHRRHRRRPSGARSAVGYVVGTRSIRRRKLNPHHRLHYRRHPNPSMRGFTGAIMPTVKAGAWGAAGALGLDALWGLLYPRLGTFRTYLANPYVGFAAKAVGAVGVGALGGKLLRGRSRELAVGAMTVVTHDFLKTLLQGLAPTIFGAGGSLPLGAYLSGSAPIVGTATIPQSYLPFSGGRAGPGFGMYLHGANSGTQNAPYSDDAMGMDPWSMSNQ